MTHESPLAGLTTNRIDAASPDIDKLSDRALVTAVMDVLANPPAQPADSFVLHAPLELMARAELLTTVDPTARELVRRRITEIATEWNGRTPHLEPATGPATSDLVSAIAQGDVDGADHAIVDLSRGVGVDPLVATAATNLLEHLGGAGHLAIYLDQIARFPRPPRAAISMSRALIRDLARQPEHTIRWIDTPPQPATGSTPTFTEVLADVPDAGDPGSNFIYPTMHLVDASGIAAHLLAGPVASTPVADARRQLLRIAAMSMLQDDPANAPYGWTHCLTMPQAALALASYTADPRRAVAIAATYVLGFRATQSNAPLDLDWEPGRPDGDSQLLDTDLHDAVAQAWHTTKPDQIERELATYAATHHDTHLAKYTLACLHATNDDPDAAPLYRAAATRLAIWWRDNDPTNSTEQQADQHDDN